MPFGKSYKKQETQDLSLLTECTTFSILEKHKKYKILLDLLALVKEEIIWAAQLISGVETVRIEVATLSFAEAAFPIGTLLCVPFKLSKLYLKGDLQMCYTIADRWSKRVKKRVKKGIKRVKSEEEKIVSPSHTGGGGPGLASSGSVRHWKVRK